MTDQDILDNAPEGATHWDGDYLKAGKGGFMFIDEDDSAEWDYQDTPIDPSKVRALSDMSKILASKTVNHLYLGVIEGLQYPIELLKHDLDNLLKDAAN
tara:strand:+ start:349 stop:645 length:297 start_codon:yes stop_codon:yes gene_type:complete